MSNVFLIFGQTGLKKEQYLKKFCDYLESFHHGREPSTKIIKFEDHLLTNEGSRFSKTTWRSKGISNRKKLEIWQMSFERFLKEEVPNWSEEYIFLEMHAIHYVHGSFYSYVIPEIISKIKPRTIVVLMDDLVGMHNNIDHKALYEEQQGLIIEPRELIYWRALEFHVAEHLQRYFRCSIYWIAIRSHPETLRKLLDNEINKKYKKVYISFPITSTRASHDNRNEIDEFRNRMYDKDDLIIFDPVTIDDLRWQHDTSDPEDVLERWPLEKRHYTLCPHINNHEKIPDNFIGNYYFVKRQIDERDLILVRQSDAVVVYRPLFNGKEVTGCMAEIREAAKQGIDIIAYNPDEDIEKADYNPFKSAVISDYAAVRSIKDRETFFSEALNLHR